MWFDAPIGYMASFLNLCRREGLNFDDFWGAKSEFELYHFIGKDIPYFHTLFWPAMLSGAGYRTPTSVFVHGHLTVDGQKMSKRRRTFIPAATFAQHLDPDYLRYYYAAKLGPGMDDLDLNFADFVAKVNSDLVGKLVNIASRCAGFVHKLGGGRLAATLPDPALYAEFAAAADDLASDFEQRDYARAVRKIMALADRANQYIDERKPWLLAKTPGKETEIVGISTLGLNLFRVLMIYLKPIVPETRRAGRKAARGRRARMAGRRRTVARAANRAVRAAADARRARQRAGHRGHRARRAQRAVASRRNTQGARHAGDRSRTVPDHGSSRGEGRRSSLRGRRRQTAAPHARHRRPSSERCSPAFAARTTRRRSSAGS